MKTMDVILIQSIKHSIRENIKAYPESYPLCDGDVSEDAAYQVINWAKNEFKQYSNEYPNQIEYPSTEKDWINICIDEYIDFFNLDYDTVKDYFQYIQS